LTIFLPRSLRKWFSRDALPKLVDRYGLHRGIFFTGLSWAATHFRSDGYPGLLVGGVLLHLASSIKGEVKKKHLSCGWNFSCFSAHLIGRDLF
jgi:hypothetical protein